MQEQVQAEEGFQQLQLREGYEEYCREQVRQAVEQKYTGEHLEAAIREQVRIIRREQPSWYERVPEAMRREVGLGKIHTLVRESLTLPTFEGWSKKDQQRRLF